MVVIEYAIWATAFYANQSLDDSIDACGSGNAKCHIFCNSTQKSI